MNTATLSRTATVLSASAAARSAQGSIYAAGVSAQTVASRHLFLGVVTIPPGERTRAHVHEVHESAFYVLSGEDIELWSGERLEHRERARAGDYLYIPPMVPHVAVNRSPTVPAVFVGARNEPTAMESVAMRPELDRCVP
jgi:uncharacterized RmlC-like cupin family protein